MERIDHQQSVLTSSSNDKKKVIFDATGAGFMEGRIRYLIFSHLLAGSISIWTKAVTVRRGELVVLTTDVLHAEDGTDKPNDILYVITKAAAHGHVGYISTPRLAIDTFSQMDVAASRVVYKHDVVASAASESLQ